MNNDTTCITGAEISSILWKIGQDPWKSNFISGFTQGDTATALLSVKLSDCGTFEGKTLEAFVQVPNTAKDIVKIFATVDSDNKAIFTLPKELLWYPGDYNINFMYADGDKVNYSNVANNAYTVVENPALSGQVPPTILPGDKAEYEELISKLNTENTLAGTQITDLKAENDKAAVLIPQATTTNEELEKNNVEAGEKITGLNKGISGADDKITELENEGSKQKVEITEKGAEIEAELDKILQNSPEGGNAVALGGKTRVEFDDDISENAKKIQNFSSKHNWYNVFSASKVKNKDNIFIKKSDPDNLQIYINHNSNIYQRWSLTRNTGLDGGVPTHVNGNPWQVNTILPCALGNKEVKNITDVDIIKVGSWTTYPPIINSASSGAYVENTITGTDIFVHAMMKNDAGIAEVSIDGIVIKEIDFYNQSTGGIYRIFKVAEGLTGGSHTVRLTVKGEKNALSTGNTIRFRDFEGITKVIDDDYSNIDEVIFSFENLRNFRYGQSAIEIAINSTYNANSNWSGTYHKYLYPDTANNQEIYCDGILRGFDNFTLGEFYRFTDFKLKQSLKMQNGDNDIADIVLLQHFSKDGYEVKWGLEWLVNCTINTSYSAMFGTSVDKLVFGDSQVVYDVNFNDGSKGDYKTFNFLGVQTDDNYMVSLKSLNEPSMQFEGINSYTYFRDRTTDAKVYIPRYKGEVLIGEKWSSNFICSIAKCNEAEFLI